MQPASIFKTIGVISRPRRANLSAVVPQLLEWLEARGLRVLYDEETASALPNPPKAFTREELADQSDILLVLGGDGTLLRAAEIARPARTLFLDVRNYFPMSAQSHVHRVISRYMAYAQMFLAEHPHEGYTAVSGAPPQCRATTRKGSACQRTPLPHNGYCPSHQHLADTEDRELAAA